MKETRKCPHCRGEKPLEAFYRVKSRKDGLASWCKECSNTQRKYQKPGVKKPSYLIVEEVVSKGGKPTDCPTCGAKGVPSHKMRGRVEKGKKVIWDCVECRNKTLEAERKVLWGCGWCDEEKLVRPSQAIRVFCGLECLEAWRKGKRGRDPALVPAMEGGKNTPVAVPA